MGSLVCETGSVDYEEDEGTLVITAAILGEVDVVDWNEAANEHAPEREIYVLKEYKWVIDEHLYSMGKALYRFGIMASLRIGEKPTM